jgi:5-methylcytosine-specific restriction endonuclease McrA
VRGYYRDWAAKNPDKILEIASRKRARKRLAIAPGYNAEAVQAKYALARRLSELFREPWHVDHIVPLARGGAHHQDNLQVIPAKVNILKSDQTELWYPDEYLIAVIGCRNPRLA